MTFLITTVLVVVAFVEVSKLLAFTKNEQSTQTKIAKKLVDSRDEIFDDKRKGGKTTIEPLTEFYQSATTKTEKLSKPVTTQATRRVEKYFLFEE